MVTLSIQGISRRVTSVASGCTGNVPAPAGFADTKEHRAKGTTMSKVDFMVKSSQFEIVLGRTAGKRRLIQSTMWRLDAFNGWKSKRGKKEIPKLSKPK